MVKKFIISALQRYPKSKKFKGVQKLKPQKSPTTFKNTEAEAAQSKFRNIFGENPGYGTGRSFRIAEASELGAKELASATMRSKWNKQITKFVTRKRSTLASRVKNWRETNLASGQLSGDAFKVREAAANYPLVKRSLKKAKLREYKSALHAADTKARSIYTKTLQRFTGKSGADPLKHKLVETKFITSRKWKKGKPKGVTDKDMLWAPKGPQGESFGRLSGAAHYERQRRKAWFNKPKVKEALAQGKTTRSKVYGAWLKDEANRRKEFADAFRKKKK